MSVTGTPSEMAKAGISIADISGGMYAYSGVLAALLRRATTGDGAHVEVSLFDGLIEWLGHQLTLTAQTGRLPRRRGRNTPPSRRTALTDARTATRSSWRCRTHASGGRCAGPSGTPPWPTTPGS